MTQVEPESFDSNLGRSDGFNELGLSTCMEKLVTWWFGL